MAVSVGAIMRECNNYFDEAYLQGAFAIDDGSISRNDGASLENVALVGRHIAIAGSLLNDGVYEIGKDHHVDGSRDEVFKGYIHLLAPPRDFLELCEEISAYDAKTPISGVVSESFGNYSATKATGSNGAVLGWKAAFSSRLMPYRKMFGGLEGMR